MVDMVLTCRALAWSVLHILDVVRGLHVDNVGYNGP